MGTEGSIDETGGGGNSLADRLKLVEAMDVDSHGDQARAAGRKLTIESSAVQDGKQKLRETRDWIAALEARLVLSEEFALLKNDPARKAWLTMQQTDNEDFAAYLAHERKIEQILVLNELREAELSRLFRLALAEIELAAAKLRFLAGATE